MLSQETAENSLPISYTYVTYIYEKLLTLPYKTSEKSGNTCIKLSQLSLAFFGFFVASRLGYDSKSC